MTDPQIPQLVHLTTGETVIPPEVLTPALTDELRRIYAAEGLRFERYVVGGPVGPDGDSLNPVTGLREFFDSAGDSVADNEAAWGGLDDDGDEGTGTGNQSYPADNDENNTRADELRGIAAEAAYNAEHASHGASETGDNSFSDYAGDGGNEDSRGRTAVTDATDDTARPVGTAPPGQAPGMAPGDLGPGLTGETFGRTAPGQTPGVQPDPGDPARTGPAQSAPAPGAAPPDMAPGDLGPGLGRTPAGFTPIGPAGPTREAAGLGRQGGGTSGQSPGAPGTTAPGATPAGAVDIDRPGKLNTIEQSSLAAEIAGGLKASYGRAWSDNLLGQLDKETAKAAGIPDVGPTQENAALLEEAEKLQNDLGPGASLGAIGAVNRGLTPGTDAFNEHMEKENAMWAARDELAVIVSQITTAREKLNIKIAAYEKAKAEVNRALGRSRGGDQRAIDAARARAKSTLAEVREEVAKLGELGRAREGLREDLNGPAPTYEEVTKPGSAWAKQSAEKNLFHGVKNTEKFVDPNGREFVFDRQTKELVTDERRGTYNFINADVSLMGHLGDDIIPALPDLAKRSPDIVRDIAESLKMEDDSYP